MTTSAVDAAGNVGTSSPVTVTVNNLSSDTTPPTVSITAPLAGASVSGSVTITASATDNVAVTQVQFFLDGVLLSTDTAAPYTFAWNSATASNGAHTLSAKAIDAAANVGNLAGVAVTVTVSNAASNVLQNKVPVTGLSGATGSSVMYTMQVPATATNLKFQLRGGTGDADLYVRFGQAPTLTTYDCRPYLGGNAETCAITAQAGTYYVMVRAYAAYSGLSLVGSYDTASGSVLVNNVPVTGLTGATGSTQYFSLVVPAGKTSVTLTMAGGTGDADMYVRFGGVPTTTTFDCRPYLNGNTETCTLAAQAGTYQVMLRAYSAFSGVSLTGRY